MSDPVVLLSTGDVVGPAGGVTDNSMVLFSGTSGKLIKGNNSVVTAQGLALLDDVDALSQRSTLELVKQTSVVDGNAGSLLINGAYGLGGSSIVNLYGSNANAYTYSGFFRLSAATNLPPGSISTDCVLLVSNAIDRGSQTCWDCATGDMWTRTWLAGSFTTWLEVAKVEDFGIGMVSTFISTSAPTGWLKANGAAISRTTYPKLFEALVTVAGFTSQNFTVTMASPGVFTKTSHGFGNGSRVRLSTTGALPTGLSTGVDYFVEVLSANTFYLSTTLMGTRIVTSGTQSGAHSYVQSWFGLGDGSTTFNLPDLRGEFLRGWDDGRGLDVGRGFATAQMDDNKSHTHTFNWGGNSGSGGPYLSNYQTTSSGPSVTNATGGEARPRNLALLVCIKY